MNIAIITGASSGLGKAYATQVSQKWPQIESIWVIARRLDRLEALCQELPKARAVALDLSSDTDLNSLEELLRTEQPHVQLLINAAGFGKIGNYEQVPRSDSEKMIDVDCKAAVAVTQIVLPYMGKGDRIAQICSTAAFQPFQGLAVYAASKAFLYRYSRALRVELYPTHISVTAVCPYWIKDTEFIPNAEQTEGSKPAVKHFLFAQRMQSVVPLSMFAIKHRFAVSTPGIVSTLHRIVAKIVPSSIMMGIWSILRRV